MHDLYYIGGVNGARIDLDCSELRVGSALELRGGEWDYKLSGYGSVGSVRRSPRAVEATVTAFDAGALEAFLTATEKDMNSYRSGSTVAASAGTLVFTGGWRQRCLVAADTPKAINAARYQTSCKFLLLDGCWRRTTVHHLTAGSETGSVTTGLDYSHDYPFDYAGTARSVGIGNFSVATDFLVRVRFYGACSNPYIRVTSVSEAGKSTSNLYGVNATAAAGEQIVIDPLAKHTMGGSVYRRGTYGAKENLFDRRVRGNEGSGSYVFATVPAGDVSVAWPQEYDVDVETLEERGTVPWISR